MAKHAKVMRFQIVKPLLGEWKELGDVLRDIQYDTRQILNKTIQLCWEYQNFSTAYKEKYEVYPDRQEVLGYKTIHGFCYDQLKGEYSRLNTLNLSATIKRGTDKWKNDSGEILRGERSIPSFKKDLPIDLANRAIKIAKTGNEYTARLSLISKAFTKELERENGMFEVVIAAKDNTQKVILDRIIDGGYTIGASQIIHRKNKWFLNLTYKFETFDSVLDPNRIMGVDIGVVHPVYIAFNDSLHRYHIKGGEIEKFRRTVEKEKNERLHQAKYAGDGRRGHGRTTRTARAHRAQNKVENFRNTTNHKYARYIVDLAMRHQCGTIQMEDLTGISMDSAFLKNWSYYDLQEKIEYKAKEQGIKVVKINPKYTSQRCNKCGNIDKENRVDQATFYCKVCGFKTSADFNAARNISMPDIEKIIEDQMAAAAKK